MNRLGIQLTPDVIDAINEELAYVDTLRDRGCANGEEYGVAGQLVTLACYTRRAEAAWVDNAALDIC